MCVRTEGTKRERERVVSLNTCMCLKQIIKKKNTKNVFIYYIDVYLIQTYQANKFIHHNLPKV